MNAAPRIIASIEARMGASRLPGKMLKEIGGVPALARMIRRVKGAASLDGIVVATTDDARDDPLAELARTEGVEVFRGSESDVLARVAGAQRQLGSDIVVELCGDCPLIDPGVIDRAVARYLESGADIVTTTAPQSYPEGMDVEVFSLAALEEVETRIFDADVREHVSLHFYRHPETYRLVGLEASSGEARPELGFLLDYPADLERLDALWRSLAARHGESFSVADVISVADELSASEAALKEAATL